jgi:SAM-dependent methyltransferase
MNHIPGGRSISSADLKEAISACYDRLAPYYTSNTRPQVREQYLAQFRSLQPGSRVLDAGCGTGLDASSLAELGLKVVAIDVSHEMYLLARDRLSKMENVEVIQADTEHLNEPDGSFAAVLSALEIFHHVDLNETVRQYARLLTPEGRLVIVTNHPVRNMLLRNPPDYFVEDFFWEDWGEHGKVPKFHWGLSRYITAIHRAGLRLESFDEICPSHDLVDVQDHAIAFTGNYPSLLILGCSK